MANKSVTFYIDTSSMAFSIQPDPLVKRDYADIAIYDLTDSDVSANTLMSIDYEGSTVATATVSFSGGNAYFPLNLNSTEIIAVFAGKSDSYSANFNILIEDNDEANVILNTLVPIKILPAVDDIHTGDTPLYDGDLGNLTETTSSVLTVTGGSLSTIGDVTIEVDQADTSNDGYLSSVDWDTFNEKQDQDDAMDSISGLTYVSDSFLKMTAEDNYVVRTIAQTKIDLSINNVTNVATSDDIYSATSWNDDTDGASKNSIRDKIVAMDSTISDNTAKETNVSTALSVGTVGINTVAITSDGGTDDVTLPAATISTAGLLTTAKWGEIVANTAKETNVSTTLEVGTNNTTVLAITSDGGADDITLPVASTSLTGVINSAIFDAIVLNTAKETNVSTSLTLDTPTSTTVPINSDGSSPDITLIEATTSTAGLLGADKWDEIVANTLKVTNSATELSLGTVTGTTLAITSDGGADDVTITASTTDDAGLMTATQYDKLAGIEALADVTDTANVTSAGALMDSEVDVDIKTLTLPASTTISVFGASLVDDADASTARTTLGVDASGTDNSTDVTIGTANGLSLSTQELSLAGADTSTTGALSSTDWNTFNDKQASISNNSVSDGSVTGQVKIWDETAGLWDNATLTEGSNITITEGDGSITIASTASGGIDWDNVITSATNAVAGKGYTMNVSASAFTLTLPAAPSAGDTIGFKSINSTTYAATIGLNGLKFEGATGDITLSDNEGGTLVYIDAAYGWTLVSELSSQTSGTETGDMLSSVYDAAGITEQVVGLTASQTLTNKTLTTPIIASISNSGTITIPTGTDTLVGKATTDTLTNKTLTSPVINVTSDATGDVYYRNAGGAFTRLAKGTDDQVLILASGIPSWEDASASGGGVDVQTVWAFNG